MPRSSSVPFPVLRGASALVLTAVTALVLLLSACSNSSKNGDESAADAGSSHGSAIIFAAASLKNVGDELAQAFAADSHDGATIIYNYGGSSTLVQQIDQGAPVDAFISADEENMDAAALLEQFRGAAPEIVATNRLVLATASGNPGSIVSLDQLKDNPQLRIAICADGVPCGTLAHEYLDSAGVTLARPTEEANVSDVSTRVATGEVDAGFMYSTDAQALKNGKDGKDGRNGDAGQGGIFVFDLPGIEDNKYPAALTTDGQNNRTAKDFFAWLETDRAREIFAKYGFGAAT